MRSTILRGALLLAGLAGLAGCADRPPAASSHTGLPASTTSTTAQTPISYPPPSRTPAQVQLDEQAAAAGITGSQSWQKPSEQVDLACQTIDRAVAATLNPAAELAHSLTNAPEQARLLQLGFPILCPQHVPALTAVLTGTIPIGDGSYEVGAELGKVKPGRWRITADVSDCYWERTRPDGTIIANQFVTHATTTAVTIGRTDGSFTTRGCGTWELVG